MLPHLQLPRHPASIAATAAGAASVLALGLWTLLRKRPDRAELERRRRQQLAASGRIVDGLLVGAEPSEQLPDVIIYRYRIAGVTYECAQDVSGVTPPVEDLRLEFPVQVRYNRSNPGDSIVVAEQWNGLWSAGQSRPQQQEPGARALTQ